MDYLSGLVPEILSLIFESLENIDDAERLAQCCKRLSDCFSPEHHRVRILRSIIEKSKIYDQDIQLCHFIDKYAESAKYYKDGPSLAVEARPDYKDFMKCFEANVEFDRTTSKQILDLQKRRSNLRVIVDLYFHHSVQAQYSASAFPYLANSKGPTAKQLCEEGPLDKMGLGPRDYFRRSGQSGTGLDPDQERAFINAIVACWLNIEAYNLAIISNHRGEYEELEMFDISHELWTGIAPQRGLLQQLHVLEAYDFIYGFLLRKIFFNVDETDEWVEDEDHDDAYQWFEFNYSSDYSRCNDFVNNARLFLRPLDIVSLTITGPPKTVLDKTMYIRSRGLFTEAGVHLSGTKSRDTPDYWYDVGRLEEGVMDVLERTSSIPQFEDPRAAWTKFRLEWAQRVRGTLFNDHASEKDMIDSIRSCDEQLDSFEGESHKPEGEDRSNDGYSEGGSKISDGERYECQAEV